MDLVNLPLVKNELSTKSSYTICAIDSGDRLYCFSGEAAVAAVAVAAASASLGKDVVAMVVAAAVVRNAFCKNWSLVVVVVVGCLVLLSFLTVDDKDNEWRLQVLVV